MDSEPTDLQKSIVVIIGLLIIPWFIRYIWWVISH